MYAHKPPDNYAVVHITQRFISILRSSVILDVDQNAVIYDFHISLLHSFLIFLDLKANSVRQITMSSQCAA